MFIKGDLLFLRLVIIDFKFIMIVLRNVIVVIGIDVLIYVIEVYILKKV